MYINRFDILSAQSSIYVSFCAPYSYLLLGLEFLIASDILKTVVDPTLDELAILGGVVIVRTVLSVFLNKEIKELAEEENSKST